MTQAPAREPVQARILVVDDEFLIALDLAESMREIGYQVIGPARDARGAIALMRRQAPHVAVIDLNLGTGAGGETLLHLLERNGCHCLVLSGDEERCRTVRERFPGCQIFAKPSPQKALTAEIERLARLAGAQALASRTRPAGGPAGSESPA